MNAVQPMLATAGPLPTGPGWAYEFKWDGVRTLADVSAAGLTLVSRLGNDVTPAYPELAGLVGVAADVLLDGEVVAFVDGRPSFSALQSRMHVRGAAQARRLVGQLPVTYLAFDVLRLYGVDLTDRPFAERRATLERLEVGRSALDGVAALRRRAGHRAGGHRERAGGRGRQAAVLDRTGRDADRGVGQGAVRPAAGVRGRRLGARRGRPGRRDRLAAARACTTGTIGSSTPDRSAPASPPARCGRWRGRCGRCVTDRVAVRVDAAGRAGAADHLGAAGGGGRGGVRRVDAGRAAAVRQLPGRTERQGAGGGRT